jgi:DNA polymerase III sliding clamp (beta) subunit (PCNA family)
MSIKLPIAELKPALLGLGKCISRSSTLPVLQSIKVDRTKEGWVVLTATDLDTFISVRLEQPAEGESLSMLVLHSDLQRITKRCGKSDVITISKADGDNARRR